MRCTGSGALTERTLPLASGGDLRDQIEGHFILGTPQQCAAELAELADTCGMTEFVYKCALAGAAARASYGAARVVRRRGHAAAEIDGVAVRQRSECSGGGEDRRHDAGRAGSDRGCHWRGQRHRQGPRGRVRSGACRYCLWMWKAVRCAW